MLGSPVKHIERGSELLSGRPGCKVTLASGALIQADHVIFTPCIGVLKALASEMFSPPLPEKKMKAIEVREGFEHVQSIFTAYGVGLVLVLISTGCTFLEMKCRVTQC